MAFRTTMIGRALILFLVVLYLVFVSATMARAQWTAEKANQCGVFLDDLLLIDSEELACDLWMFSSFYLSATSTPRRSDIVFRCARPWIVGCNFIPSNAINQLEMWQADTFDPITIDRELSWAQGLGFNSIRVFLHNFLWDQDSEGFLNRVDQFLDLASKRGISTMLVLFDSVWDANPRPGTQRAPVPFIHNSGWLQAPGIDIFDNPARYPELEGYVKGVIGRFANDSRVNVWDVFNEPDNINAHSYRTYSSPNRATNALTLLTLSYGWARSLNPIQPLTSGVWAGDLTKPTPLQQYQLTASDVISFHSYDPMPGLLQRVQILQAYGRPLINTEYMARPMGSTFNPMMGYFRANKIGCHNWGFVSGKTQTIMPWDSWCMDYTAPPLVWFHDIFDPNGAPFSTTEVKYIKSITQDNN